MCDISRGGTRGERVSWNAGSTANWWYPMDDGDRVIIRCSVAEVERDGDEGTSAKYVFGTACLTTNPIQSIN